MKALLLFCIIFLIPHNEVAATPNSKNYKAIAVELLKQVVDFQSNLNRVSMKVRDLQININNIGSAIDYGIPQNARITALKATFENLQSKKGIESCARLYNATLTDLRNELTEAFTSLVTKQLETNEIGLTNAHNEINDIADNLQGSNLKVQIQRCKTEPENCRLLSTYPNLIDKDKKYVDMVEAVTDTLLQTILDTAIYPMVENKIEENIFEPVNQCIAKL